MDLPSIILTSLILLYGIVQYQRRERWFHDAMLLTTRGNRVIVFSRTLETFRIIVVAGALIGLFMLSGLKFMLDELEGSAPAGLSALALVLAFLLVLLAVLMLWRELRRRGKPRARPIETETGLPL